MKTIVKIAKECGVNRRIVAYTAKSLGFKGKELSKAEEDELHRVMYFSGRFTELTIESKMNKNKQN